MPFQRIPAWASAPQLWPACPLHPLLYWVLGLPSHSKLLLLFFATKDDTFRNPRAKEHSHCLVITLSVLTSMYIALNDCALAHKETGGNKASTLSARRSNSRFFVLFCFGFLAGGVHPATINPQFVFHLRYSSGGSENTFIYIASFGGYKRQLP